MLSDGRSASSVARYLTRLAKVRPNFSSFIAPKANIAAFFAARWTNSMVAGDLIAFTQIYKGSLYIGVMRPDGSGEGLI